MSTEQVIKTVSENVMPTYGRFDLALTKGHGATVYDEEGKEYIDFGSGIGVNSLGFTDDGWVNAICEQAKTLSHISNLYYNDTQAKLAKKLCEMSGFSKVFFGNSGAEANEGAIKVARKYSFDTYGEGRSTIVTLKNSFHGRTITTLAATGQPQFHTYFFPFTQGFKFLDASDGFEKIKPEFTDDVCAVMLESIQGEGGIIPLTEEFVKEVFDFCKEKDILVIFDEVQTGIGRTGKFLGF
ncbi:MAG: aminotransferase class III-fold pyridoxal phosphate-dependent enzyme, partial [Candidatus Izemoplasmatales bacterium]|nr:aminotransferase class III-fold pyridoxal phosphate-dependent enzyme [Candidatus Izemoplasmatales bacterium]